MKCPRYALLPVLLCTLTFAAYSADAPKYAVSAHWAVAGEGGWDYLTFDTAGHRIFISRGTHVLVVDAATGKVTGDIANTPGVHGIVLMPELNLGATTNGRSNTISLFDLKTLAKTGEVKTGGNPDAAVYDAFSHLLFVFNGKSNDVTVVDPAKATVVKTIAVGGKPEFPASDGRGRVYVNIEDKNEVIALDTRELAMVAHWPLAGCDEPSGLALDAKNARIFSVCGSQLMTVLDATSGKLVTTVPIGKRADAAAYDAEKHLAFSSNGEGTLTVVHQDSADKYTVVDTVPTAPGARTMALDPVTHTVYLVTAKFGPAPAPTEAQPHPRPSMLPGSFEVLVVTQK